MKRDALIKKSEEVCDEDTVSVLKDRVTIYATVEGVAALRTREGTFFVQALMKIFADLAHHLDVYELAMRVNHHMMSIMQGTTTNVDSTLRKKFFLNPTEKKVFS